MKEYLNTGECLKDLRTEICKDGSFDYDNNTMTEIFRVVKMIGIAIENPALNGRIETPVIRYKTEKRNL